MKVIDLGISDYLKALELQEDIFKKKIKKLISEDFVIITQHRPVYTAGKSFKKEHIINIPENVEIVHIERGGSITFHGHGQLVIYPIIDLNKKKISVKNYIWILEEIIINTLKDYNINGFRIDKRRGVFTEKGKIGFIGVKISKYISYHGFSINVKVNKEYFSHIVPCGISDIPVCNIYDFDKNIALDHIKQSVIKYLKIFFRS